MKIGPDEMREAPKFVTRHLANTLLSHVDAEVVPYLGYLPQDMIGRSIFDFYHPKDLPLLKEIYESGECNSPKVPFVLEKKVDSGGLSY